MSASDGPQWRLIAGWPNYEVSDQGQVRSLPRERARGGVLRAQRDSGRYWKVALSRKAEVKRFRIHKLVAEAFIGPCPPGQEVRHLNDDKDDNRVGNLGYGTRRDNVQDAVRNEVRRRQRRPPEPRAAREPRTHCRRQHELTHENAPVGPDGRRRCRRCIADRYQRRKAGE